MRLRPLREEGNRVPIFCPSLFNSSSRVESSLCAGSQCRRWSSQVTVGRLLTVPVTDPVTPTCPLRYEQGPTFR